MSISCDPSDLANLAWCMNCTSGDLMAIRSYLLCQLVSACRAPLAPTSLEVTSSPNNPGSTTITVDWTQPLNIPPDHITSYVIRWGLSSGNYQFSATIAAPASSYAITGLTPSTSYFVVVQAVATTCVSANSNELATATTAPLVDLPQLANLILKLESLDFDGTANGTALTVWNDKSGAGHNFNLVGAALIGNPAQPTVDGAALLNAHKTVRFAGANAIGIAAFPFAAAPGVEMIAVYKVDSDASDNYMLELMRPGNTTQAIQPFGGGTFFECFGRTDRPAIGNPVTPDTAFFAYDVSSKSDNSAYNAWANTENFFTSAVYTFANVQGATQTTLGCAYTGATNVFATGNIAAVYAWNVALSASERLQARAYIKQTWGNSFGF